MAKWESLPRDPFYYQSGQMAFLEARRQRWCQACERSYSAIPEVPVCPSCGQPGVRMFDRLTIIAGRRFGKTVCGALAGVEEAGFPYTIGWACAPTNPKLHRYVIPAFQKLIPQEWVQNYNSEFLDLRLKNGSLIHFQTLEDPDQGRGQGLNWLWIDEGSELTRRHWETIEPSLGEHQGVAIMTTSPRSYDWVYEDLYRPAEEGMPGFWALKAKTIDNPLFQTPAGRAWIEARRQTMSPEMFRQEHEGDFVIFTGAVYGGLIDPQILRTDEEIKKIIPEWPEIDPHYKVTVGIDTGADHPFGALKLIATPKGLVCIGEYLERDRSFLQHAQALKLLAGSPDVRWAINKNERQQMIELRQHGILCLPAANDVVAGIERVKSWLIRHQLWFIERLVPRTIRQLKAYRWDENTSVRDEQKRRERVFKLHDELPDCLRYAVMSWPDLPTRETSSTPRHRDISHLPPAMQATIQKLRELERPPQEPDTIVGDFYA